MKIYSKFIDYYDHVCRQTDNYIWLRKTESFALDPSKKLPLNLQFTKFLIKAMKDIPLPHIAGIGNYVFLFGFCGKLYVIYEDSNRNMGWPNNDICNDVSKPYLDIPKFTEAYFKSTGVKIDTSYKWYLKLPFTTEGLNAWYQEFDNKKLLEELFLNLGSPIFVVKSAYTYGNMQSFELTANPKLLEYNIQRIFNPWITFQEIEMYLTNTLATNRQKIPKFSDKLKRDAHGFNNLSFKQVGPKRRKLKKKNKK